MKQVLTKVGSCYINSKSQLYLQFTKETRDTIFDYYIGQGILLYMADNKTTVTGIVARKNKTGITLDNWLISKA